jgi:hypothetical protein
MEASIAVQWLVITRIHSNKFAHNSRETIGDWPTDQSRVALLEFEWLATSTEVEESVLLEAATKQRLMKT